MNRMTVFALAFPFALATAHAAEPPPEAVLAELAFAKGVRGDVVIVDLAPEGHRRPLLLQLDTGAQHSVITPGVARDLGIATRRLKSTPYRRSTLLGRDLQFYIDVGSSDTGPRTFEYGLLGGNFLSHYVVEIDYPGERVRFLDRKEYEVPQAAQGPDQAVLPLRVSANRPFVEVELEGERILLLVDTGAAVPLLVSGRQAKRVGLDTRAAEGVDFWGVRGPVRVRLAEAKRVLLGPFEFANLPVLVAPRGFYQQAGSADSAIGSDVLRAFVLRIDYRRKRLWLRRDPAAEVTLLGIPVARDSSGGIAAPRAPSALGLRRGESDRVRMLFGEFVGYDAEGPTVTIDEGGTTHVYRVRPEGPFSTRTMVKIVGRPAHLRDVPAGASVIVYSVRDAESEDRRFARNIDITYVPEAP